jgi:PAS domain-containing protein
MIYISINSNFPAFLALFIMIVVALMNLILSSGKLLFASNLVIAVILGMGLLLTSATIRYALSYYSAYLLVTGLSYYINHNRMNYQKFIEREKEKYVKFIENIPIAFANHKLVYDETGKAIDYQLIDVNKSFEKILDVNKEKILGENLSPQLISNEDEVLELIDIFATVSENRSVVTLDQYLSAIDKWLRITAYSEKTGYFKAFFRDITEEKAIERALKSSEQRYRKIFTSAPIGLMIEDDQGNIIEVNEELCKMSGYQKDE